MPKAIAPVSIQASYVAAKIAMDLKRIQRLVGRGVPTNEEIANYEQEAVFLLQHGYWGVMTYGFTRNNEWVLAVRYTAANADALMENTPAYASSADTDIFSSFLYYSNKWQQLTPSEQREYEENLPDKRVSRPAPKGDWEEDNIYRAGKIQVQRHSLKRPVKNMYIN